MQKKLSDSVGVIWPKPFEEVIRILKIFAKELMYRGDVREIWLFGSYATGEYTARSDVDLCIVLDDESDLTYSDISRIFYDISVELEGQFHVYKNSEFKRMIERDSSFVKEILKGINIVELLREQDGDC